MILKIYIKGPDCYELELCCIFFPSVDNNSIGRYGSILTHRCLNGDSDSHKNCREK